MFSCTCLKANVFLYVTVYLGNLFSVYLIENIKHRLDYQIEITLLLGKKIVNI